MAYGRYVFILQPEYGRIAQFLTVFFFFFSASKQKLRCTLGLHIWWWFTFLCLYIIYIGFAGLRKYSLTGHEPPEPMKKYSDHIYIYIYYIIYMNIQQQQWNPRKTHAWYFYHPGKIIPLDFFSREAFRGLFAGDEPGNSKTQGNQAMGLGND